MKFRLLDKTALATIVLILASTAQAADHTVSNTKGDESPGSFRQIVKDSSTDDTIRFASGISSIPLSGSALNPSTQGLTIIGNAGQNITFDGQKQHSLLRLTYVPNPNSTFYHDTLENLTFTNATLLTPSQTTPSSSSYDGGAVYIGGNGIITNTVFNDNFIHLTGLTKGSYLYGGAMSSGGVLTLTDSTFTNNILEAIQGHVTAADVDMTGSFHAFGGAVSSKRFSNSNEKNIITRSTFKDNKVMVVGGTADDGVTSISLSATATGGAFEGGHANIYSSAFIGNVASATGGISPDPTNRTINTWASAYGGAICTSLFDVGEIKDSLFKDNAVLSHYGNGPENGQHIALGGAIDLSAFAGSTLTITNSSFLNNSVVATTEPEGAAVSTLAAGGAMTFRTFFPGDFTVNIGATEGKETVFRGNTVKYREDDAKANAIDFFVTQPSMNPDDTNIVNLGLNITTEKDALVAMDDPMVFGSYINTTITVSGAGIFRWGGWNEFTQAEDATTKIDFKSGSVLLRSDFSAVRSSTKEPMQVVMSKDVHLYTDMTFRNKDTAMFSDDTNFNIDKTKLTALNYSLIADAGTKKYLVAQGLTINDFVVTDDPNGWFKTSLSTDAGKLYISVDNTVAVDPIVNSPNGNVRRAYQNGEMNTVYLKVLAETDPSLWAEKFAETRNNPQRLTPEAIATQGIVARDWSGNFTRSLWQTRDPLSKSAVSQCDPCKPCGSNVSRRWNLWGGYVGSNAQQYVQGGYSGYQADINGVMVGAERAMGRNFDVGSYFVYGGGKTKSNSLASQIESDAYQFGLYGSWKPNRHWSVNSDVSFGRFTNDSIRSNAFGAYTGSFGQNLFNFGLLAKRDYRFGRTTKLSPYVGLRYINIDQDSVTESGLSGFATSVAGTHAQSLDSVFGASVAMEFRAATVTLFTDWRHEFSDTRLSTLASYAGSPQSFVLQSVGRERDSADLGCDVKKSWNGQNGRLWRAHTGYNANLANCYQNQMYYVTLALEF
ncbi:MAG: autotransporter outer membrane beta-barrel domain-containing protein [Thermoguttaceae bacterium]